MVLVKYNNMSKNLKGISNIKMLLVKLTVYAVICYFVSCVLYLWIYIHTLYTGYMFHFD